MTEAADVIIVITNVPDGATADTLAKRLIEDRLAACVNVLAPASSLYRWKGAVESAHEVPVLIKTRLALYGKVESLIREVHPYELPEVLAVPVVRGLPGYLQWVVSETSVAA